MRLLKVAYEDSFTESHQIRPYSYFPEVSGNLYFDAKPLDLVPFIKQDIFPDLPLIKQKVYVSLQKKITLIGFKCVVKSGKYPKIPEKGLVRISLREQRVFKDFHTYYLQDLSTQYSVPGFGIGTDSSLPKFSKNPTEVAFLLPKRSGSVKFVQYIEDWFMDYDFMKEKYPEEHYEFTNAANRA